MTEPLVKPHLRESFLYKSPLKEGGLLQRIKEGNLFGYVQCNIEVPEHMREKFANVSTILKNTYVSEMILDLQ